MRDVVILGVGMTRFGKFPEQSLKRFGRDAGIEKPRVAAAYVSNAIAGLITGQEMIRGQIIPPAGRTSSGRPAVSACRGSPVFGETNQRDSWSSSGRR